MNYGFIALHYFLLPPAWKATFQSMADVSVGVMTFI